MTTKQTIAAMNAEIQRQEQELTKLREELVAITGFFCKYFLETGGRMTPSMNAEELAALMPLAQYISVTDAAQILGGGKTTVQNLIERVTSGEIFSWSHSSPHTAPSVVIYKKIGIEQERPAVTPDTDPATVLIPSKDVVWCWCRDIERLLVPTGDTTMLEARISARLQALQNRAYELKT